MDRGINRRNVEDAISSVIETLVSDENLTPEQAKQTVTVMLIKLKSTKRITDSECLEVLKELEKSCGFGL